MKRMHQSRHASHRSDGLSLVLVLWTLVALSLMVATMTRSVRGDVQQITRAQSSLQGRSLAVSALNQALLSLTAPNAERVPQEQTVEFQVRGVTVTVVRTPLTGWIDINQAPETLLQALFVQRLGWADGRAGELAAAVAQARSRKDAKGLEWRFDAVEDLMGVPGIGFTQYLQIADLLTADLKTGSGRVNALAAPREVLMVLAGGNEAAVAAIEQSRGVNGPPPDLSRLNPNWIDNDGSGPVRLRALVPLPDGRTYHLDWTVYLIDDAQTGLPWRVVRQRQGFLPT